ncbi:MAG: hypothetical protein KBD78_15955 [Oligoflexales bacterium]|nr:hypothetical protein [Oligoflexales bacterium]
MSKKNQIESQNFSVANFIKHKKLYRVLIAVFLTSCLTRLGATALAQQIKNPENLIKVEKATSPASGQNDNELLKALPDFQSLKPLLTLDFSALQNNYHPWRQYTGEFRELHHFSYDFGYGQSVFHINKLAGLTSQNLTAKSQIHRFHYNFYLPIYDRLGYFLGSSFGVVFDSPDNEKLDFESQSIEFPGLTLGLSYNFSPLLRLNMTFMAGIERMHDLKAPSASDASQEQTLAINLRTWDRSVGLDYFYRLNWALKFSYHQKISSYSPPKDANKTHLDASFSKSAAWFGLGISYHLI